MTSTPTDAAIEAAIHEAEIYGVNATSDMNQKVLLQVAKAYAAHTYGDGIEAAAKICEEVELASGDYVGPASNLTRKCAAAIRALALKAGP